MKFKNLNYEDIVSINVWAQRIIENNIVPSFGIREENLLMSIPEMVDQNIGGQELYPTIYDKAAYLWGSLSKYHCFFDGNKRTALLVLIIYLRLNGYRLDISTSNLYETCIRLASENISKNVIKNYLIENTDKYKCDLDTKNELEIIELLNEFCKDTLLIPILRKLGS